MASFVLCGLTSTVRPHLYCLSSLVLFDMKLQAWPIDIDTYTFDSFGGTRPRQRPLLACLKVLRSLWVVVSAPNKRASVTHGRVIANNKRPSVTNERLIVTMDLREPLAKVQVAEKSSGGLDRGERPGLYK